MVRTTARRDQRTGIVYEIEAASSGQGSGFYRYIPDDRHDLRPGGAMPMPRRRRWSSHKDIAAKALRKLAGPHVPASLTKLEQAVKRAHNAYDKAETQAREQQHAARQPVKPEADDGIGNELDEDLDATT